MPGARARPLQAPAAGPARQPRRLMLAAVASAGLWLAGCAQPPALTDAPPLAWAGRLAVQVEGHPSQSFSAGFELQGSPQAGQLVLLSPLGSTIAQLQWDAREARLMRGGDIRNAPSLDLLLHELTGTDIPVAAMFGWLQGTQASATGWQADLSGLPDGRLTAQRVDPPPATTLRVVLAR